MKKKNRSFFKENSKRLVSVFGANLASNILPGISYIFLYLIVMQLAVPVLIGQQTDYMALWRYCIWYAGVFILYILLSMWSQTKTNVEAYAMSSELRMAMGDKLRRLSLSYFKQNDPGDIASRLLSDVQKTETIIARILPDMTTAFVAPVILIIFLAAINGALAGIILSSIALAGIFLFIARKTISVLGSKHVKTVVETSSRILEYFKTIKLLKSYNLTGDRFETMKKAMLRLKKISFRTEVWAAIPIQIFLFCLDAGYLIMLFAAVKMCASGSMSVQGLFTFAFIGYFLFETVKSLGPQLVELRYVSLPIKRIGEIFEAEEPPYSDLKEPPETNCIIFDNVSFGYSGSDVLNGVSCRIPEKSMTALVGMSGSGKTTMTSLIARFWDVQSGEILIGDIPINEMDPDKLLTKISMVFQDVYLFSDTIANNIGIGKKGASMDEIKRAAELASCDEFIETLPNGYDTLVSEGGNSLSGGEKQRISIARAILKDAPIVILDEATASLDPENESEIQKAFENLVKEKTVIVIAHQFKSIEHADNILVLDKGYIKEQGAHRELIESNGLYSKLWKEQQKARGWKMTASDYNR